MARKSTKKANVSNAAETVKSIAPVQAAALEETVAEAAPAEEAAEEVKEADKEAVKEEMPKKRGRKPGVKNKAKAEKAPAKVEKTAEKTENIFVESAGYQYKTEDIAANVRAAWVAEGHRAGSIKTLNIYINMDERTAYYVINDKNTGSVGL